MVTTTPSALGVATAEGAMGRPALFIEMLSAVFQASVESGVVEDEPKNSEHAAAAYLCRMKITCRGAPWCTRPQAG